MSPNRRRNANRQVRIPMHYENEPLYNKEVNIKKTLYRYLEG